MISGFINLYKEGGMTSQKAVSRLKGILKAQGVDFVKAGHLGTLDPDAEGVLPVAIGRATRLFDYFLDKKKVYYAEFEFGKTTDTLDGAGVVTATSDFSPDKAQILKEIPSLTGRIAQIPPAYSAKSVDGERAYALARKGETPDLKPKEVEIYKLELKEELEKGVFSFIIECGGGTYIRSIARDLAAKCKTLGYMRYLKRLESGGFNEKNSYTLKELENGVSGAIIPLEETLKGYPRLDLSGKTGEKALYGVPLILNNLPKDGFFTVYVEGILCGIAEGSPDGELKIKTRLL